MLPVSNLLVAIMIPRVLTRSDLQGDCSSRRTSLPPDRTASGPRAGALIGRAIDDGDIVCR